MAMRVQHEIAISIPVISSQKGGGGPQTKLIAPKALVSVDIGCYNMETEDIATIYLKESQEDLLTRSGKIGNSDFRDQNS